MLFLVDYIQRRLDRYPLGVRVMLEAVVQYSVERSVSKVFFESSLVGRANAMMNSNTGCVAAVAAQCTYTCHL